MIMFGDILIPSFFPDLQVYLLFSSLEELQIQWLRMLTCLLMTL